MSKRNEQKERKKNINTVKPAGIKKRGSELDADAEFNIFYPPSAGRGRS
jgi:hypothetical protein